MARNFKLGCLGHAFPRSTACPARSLAHTVLPCAVHFLHAFLLVGCGWLWLAGWLVGCGWLWLTVVGGFWLLVAAEAEPTLYCVQCALPKCGSAGWL